MLKLRSLFLWIFPTEITFSNHKIHHLSAGAAVNPAGFARKALHPDDGSIHACHCPMANCSKPPFLQPPAWQFNNRDAWLSCRHHYCLLRRWSFLTACLPRCPNAGGDALGSLQGQPSRRTGHAYIHEE